MWYSVKQRLCFSGVFARDTHIIPQRTCFGPLVGQHCSNMDLSDWPEKDTPQIWKVSELVRWSLISLGFIALKSKMCNVELPFLTADVPQQCSGVLHRHNRRERVQLDDVCPQGEVGHTWTLTLMYSIPLIWWL